MSHGEAGQILSQVESALDKVTGPMEEVKLTSFTGRLLGILTRTVKYVTDVSLLIHYHSVLNIFNLTN